LECFGFFLGDDFRLFFSRSNSTCCCAQYSLLARSAASRAGRSRSSRASISACICCATTATSLALHAIPCTLVACGRGVRQTRPRHRSHTCPQTASCGGIGSYRKNHATATTTATRVAAASSVSRRTGAN
jgi:hypothetical protein